MNEPADATASGLIDGIRANAKLAVICGVVLIVVGTFAVMSPLIAGLYITIMVGASLIIGGVGQIVSVFDHLSFDKGVRLKSVSIGVGICVRDVAKCQSDNPGYC